MDPPALDFSFDRTRFLCYNVLLDDAASRPSHSMTANYLLAEASSSHVGAVWSTRWLRPLSGHADGLVLSGGADKRLRVWSPASPAQPIELLAPPGKQSSLGLVSVDGGEDEDGPYAVTSSLDSVLCRWSIGRGQSEGGGKIQGRKVMKPAQTFTMALHPRSSNPVLATTGAGSDVVVLDASSGPSFGTELAHMEGRGSYGMSIAYSPDGRLLANASDSGQVSLFDAESHQLIQTFPAHATTIRALTFTSTGLLITGSDDRRLNVFDVRASHHATSSQGGMRKGGGGHVASLGGHEGWVVSVAARDDGKVLASSSSDGSIKLWDLSRPTSALTTLRDSPGDVWSLAWRPDAAALPSAPSAQIEGIRSAGLGGGMLVSGAEDGGVRWWRGTG